MQRTAFYYIAGLLLCFVLFFTFCSCNKNGSVTGPSSLTQSDGGLDFNASTTKPYAPKPETPRTEAGSNTKMNQANIYSSKDSIKYSDMMFSNFKLTKSKQLPESITKEQVNYFSETTNDKGTLTGSETYVFVTMDITNLTDQIQENYLNGNIFVQLDSDFSFSFTSICARYRNGSADKEAKEYFRQIFNPHETITCTLGYILEDVTANADNLYYFVSSPSLSLNKDSKGFKVN